MLTGALKSQIDRIWNAFWTGGVSNPISVVEQLSYLLFMKRLDDLHTLAEKKANRSGKPIENPIFAPDKDHLRWSKFKSLEAGEMLTLVQQEAFPEIKKMGGGPHTAFARYMKDAVFIIAKASMLAEVVELVDGLEMEDRDTKGDVYEYLLSQLTTAGKNGQFRTPRHIIKMMVAMANPGPSHHICDPACGTAGFLMAAGEYIREHHGELFHNREWLDHFNNEAFHGYDFDQSMLRIGAMNMMLHGVENPNIQDRDTLSKYFDEASRYDLILANPPFKGSLKEAEVAENLLDVVKTKKTELLFLALFLRLLKKGGRCAAIVPDGVLFGGSKAHKQLRRTLVEDHQLEAVVSMPSGVFKPYAGVSTGMLFFTKTGAGGTDKVWFYDMKADGFSLDDKRTPLGEGHDHNNIPDLLNRWASIKANPEKEAARARTDQSFLVPKDEIAGNDYDLSINRYKEIVYEEVVYDPPHQIIARVEQLQKGMDRDLALLKEMLV